MHAPFVGIGVTVMVIPLKNESPFIFEEVTHPPIAGKETACNKTRRPKRGSISGVHQGKLETRCRLRQSTQVEC